MAITSSSEPIQLVVLTPSKKVVEINCKDVSFPSGMGRLQILPGHAELICQVGTGVVYYTHENSVGVCAVSGGVADIGDNKVTLLADIAEDAYQIDPNRAQTALDRAQSRLGGKAASQEKSLDMARAASSEEKAKARLEAAKMVSRDVK